MALNIGYLKKPTGISKILEIIFVVISFSILRDQELDEYNVDVRYFGVGIHVSCMIITPLLLVCYLMGKMDIQQTVMEVSVNAIFALFLLIHGIMGMNYYVNLLKVPNHNQGRDSGIAMSFFSLAAGVVYFADTVFAALNYRK